MDGWYGSSWHHVYNVVKSTYAEIAQQLVPFLFSKHFALAVVFALERFEPHFTVPRIFVHGCTHVVAGPVSKLFEGFLDRLKTISASSTATLISYRMFLFEDNPEPGLSSERYGVLCVALHPP